jgi:hypothetical protein
MSSFRPGEPGRKALALGGLALVAALTVWVGNPERVAPLRPRLQSTVVPPPLVRSAGEPSVFAPVRRLPPVTTSATPATGPGTTAGSGEAAVTSTRGEPRPSPAAPDETLAAALPPLPSPAFDRVPLPEIDVGQVPRLTVARHYASLQFVLPPTDDDDGSWPIVAARMTGTVFQKTGVGIYVGLRVAADGIKTAFVR